MSTPGLDTKHVSARALWCVLIAHAITAIGCGADGASPGSPSGSNDLAPNGAGSDGGVSADGAVVGDGGTQGGTTDTGVGTDATTSTPTRPDAGTRYPPGQDIDGDGLLDADEDRNQDGVLDPGETDPNKADTDGDGILDGDEVSTAACSRGNDRPFTIHDLPGADAMVLVDAQVSRHSVLRTAGGRAPGGVFYDPALQVAAALVAKAPATGVTSPAAQRDHEVRALVAPLGTIHDQRTRAFTTWDGFAAEQAQLRVGLSAAVDAAALVNRLATGLAQDAQLTGLLAPAGDASAEAFIDILTIRRSATEVVILVAAVVGGSPSDAQHLRLEELTDGTNVGLRGAFTRHVCDEFETGVATGAVDILWVIDDSGSMKDDQEAVRAAADAMAGILSGAGVDFRLGVARMFAPYGDGYRNRGRLEGGGLTRDIEEFKRRVVVEVGGGWEPGLETGIAAIDRLLPRTAAGATERADRLREGAALVVVHLSDERDQHYECAGCGGCTTNAEGRPASCTRQQGQAVIDEFIEAYKARGAVTFAIVADLPNGCRQPNATEDFEPGQGYVEVANATGGRFGSLCGDMRENLAEVGRVAAGVASSFVLSKPPASATLKVAIGAPGEPRVVPRNRLNGFDFDPASGRITFHGDAVPQSGFEVVVGYRRWDLPNNPDTPSDPCDHCPGDTTCVPEFDIAVCAPICGDTVCEPGEVCSPDTGQCTDPGGTQPDPDPSPTPGGTCDSGCESGYVCDPAQDACVPSCEDAGCVPGLVCNPDSQLCEIPQV